MWGVVAGIGSVVTVSTRLRPAELERLARARLARDGVTQLAAQVSNGRQVRLLLAVRDRLVADPALSVYGSGQDYGDGMTYVSVHPAGTRPKGVMGQPRGVAEDDPADVHVEFLDDDDPPD